MMKYGNFIEVYSNTIRCIHVDTKQQYDITIAGML